ncbi:TPR Domain containing protein [Aphelenchoides besseyi]|nr:TPR Domain containing protein [Aphelenchoides besseyi]KAI6216703.1 TPR Domain containing protein [Aphelenchoides besseyi]
MKTSEEFDSVASDVQHDEKVVENGDEGKEKTAEDERQTREDAMDDSELAQLQETATKIKTDGNRKFGEGDYKDALVFYTEALDTCPLKYKDDRSVLLSNRAAANIKLEDWTAAVDDATASIELGAKNEKSLERRAFAYAQKDETIEKSLEDYNSLQKQFPDRSRYTQQIATLTERQKVRNEKLQKEMVDQLKNLGNVVLRPFGLSTDSFQMVEQPGGGYSIQMKK